MKIVVSFRLDPKYAEQIRQAAGPESVVGISPFDDQLVRDLADAEVLFAGRFNRRLLAAAPRLRWVHAIGAGVEDLLIPELVASPIVVTNSRGVAAVPVAEHVFALLLAFTRELPTCFREQQRHRWGVIRGDDLEGKTLGIVGFGAIGEAIARRAKAFDLRVIASRQTRAEASQYVDVLLPPEELHLMLEEADVVVIVAPLTRHTAGLFGEREFRAMKPSALLINVGRGRIVQEDQLVRALREGWIAGAALDVFAEEPLPPDSPLWELPNVIITPHCAGSTRTYLDRAIPLFCENLRRFQAGAPLLNVVDKQRGY